MSKVAAKNDRRWPSSSALDTNNDRSDIDDTSNAITILKVQSFHLLPTTCISYRVRRELSHSGYRSPFGAQVDPS